MARFEDLKRDVALYRTALVKRCSRDTFINIYEVEAVSY